MLKQIFQINQQPAFGGGEVYTAFVCRALDQLGIRTQLLCHPQADFWRNLALPESTMLLPVSAEDIPSALPEKRSWVLSHGPLASHLTLTLAQNHLLTAIAHMPPQGRVNDLYRHYQQVFGVSAYVVDGLHAIGVPTWQSPLYGVAVLERGASKQPLRQKSCYDWDRRKGRDRMLAALEPLAERFRCRPLFETQEGVTLGIVSRLTPIKQFPQLFAILAPLIAREPRFHLDIFGSGGYASVRDLKQALRPLGKRVRFWGQQQDVAAVYSQLDYLMTGLPEKEALGLNIIEAQACGIPVLAVNAPPFTETVLDGKTGYLYRDPRDDRGANFAELLARIASTNARIDPREATDHLARFSFAAFVERMRPIAEWVDTAITATVSAETRR